MSVLFDPDSFGHAHPARFTPAILGVIAGHLEPGWSVFDPFCGVGGVHQLRALVPGLRTEGCEIEPKWAAAHPDTVCSDLFDLGFPPGRYDAVVTSVTYGNRMADTFKATNPTGRRSYTLVYGEDLHTNNAGRLQWGPEYRRFHQRAWAHITPWAPKLILNVKDHQRGGERQAVTRWHQACLTLLGWQLDEEQEVPAAPGYRYGANPERFPEMVLVFKRRR